MRFPRHSGHGVAFARSCARRRRPSASLRTGPPCRRWNAWSQGGWDRLVVMENEKIVGLVTRSAIAHFTCSCIISDEIRRASV